MTPTPAPTTELPIKDIKPSADNPRVAQPSKDDDEQLIASIKSIGIINPITVVKNGKGYVTVAGARRLAAAKTAGLKTIPATVLPNADNATEIAFSENTMRTQMHPADEMITFRDSMRKGEDIKAVANRFGVTQKLVRQRIYLANLSDRVIAIWRNNEIDLETAKAFSGGPHEIQDRILDKNQEQPGHTILAWRVREEMKGEVSRQVAKYAGAEYVKRKLPYTRDLFDDDINYHDAEAINALAIELLLKEPTAPDYTGFALTAQIDNPYNNLPEGAVHCDKSALAISAQAYIDWHGDAVIAYYKADPHLDTESSEKGGEITDPNNKKPDGPVLSQALQDSFHTLVRKCWATHVNSRDLDEDITEELAAKMLYTALQPGKEWMYGNQLCRNHHSSNPVFETDGDKIERYHIAQVLVAYFLDPEQYGEVEWNMRDYWTPDSEFLSRLKGPQIHKLIIDLSGVDPLNTEIEMMQRKSMTKKDWVEMAVQMFTGTFAPLLSIEAQAKIDTWRP